MGLKINQKQQLLKQWSGFKDQQETATQSKWNGYKA